MGRKLPSVRTPSPEELENYGFKPKAEIRTLICVLKSLPSPWTLLGKKYSLYDFAVSRFIFSFKQSSHSNNQATSQERRPGVKPQKLCIRFTQKRVKTSEIIPSFLCLKVKKPLRMPYVSIPYAGTGKTPISRSLECSFYSRSAVSYDRDDRNYRSYKIRLCKPSLLFFIRLESSKDTHCYRKPPFAPYSQNYDITLSPTYVFITADISSSKHPNKKSKLELIQKLFSVHNA